MKKLLFAFIGYILTNSCFSQVPPNSNRFDVENYIAIDNTGKYYPYTVHGFYENAAIGATARIYILPVLNLDLTKIKFIDQQGNETNQSDENIRSLIIPVSRDLALPNESQKAAIIAAIKGHTTIKSFFAPIVKNPAGQPFVNPLVNSNPELLNQILSMANSYETNAIIPQQNLINDYNSSYKAQIISLAELEIIVEAGSEIVYSKRIPGSWITTGGTISKITIETIINISTH